MIVFLLLFIYVFLCFFLFLVSPAGSVLVTPFSTNSQVGGIITLSCDASGGPDNAFAWTRSRDGEVVSNQQVVNISISTFMDGGVYSCNVSNPAGFESDDSTVNGKYIIKLNYK